MPVTCRIRKEEKHGEKLTIGPDYDCIDLISIRQYPDDDKYTEIIVTKEQAMLILSALNKMKDDHANIPTQQGDKKRYHVCIKQHAPTVELSAEKWFKCQ